MPWILWVGIGSRPFLWCDSADITLSAANRCPWAVLQTMWGTSKRIGKSQLSLHGLGNFRNPFTYNTHGHLWISIVEFNHTAMGELMDIDCQLTDNTRAPSLPEHKFPVTVGHSNRWNGCIQSLLHCFQVLTVHRLQVKQSNSLVDGHNTKAEKQLHTIHIHCLLVTKQESTHCGPWKQLEVRYLVPRYLGK